MPIEITVPPLGESVSEAVVTKWLQPVGARVAVDAPVVEVETDKITFEVPAPAPGVLVAHTAREGQVVRGGQVLGVIDDAAGPGNLSPGPGKIPPRGS